MSECNVCCEKFNKNTNTSIVCKMCDYNACKKCIKKYILGSINQPHCMNCKVMWNNNYLIKNLNKTFLNTEFKKSRNKILLDEHKSKLIDYMYLITYETEKRKLIKEEQEESNKLQIMKNELSIQQKKVNKFKRQILNMKIINRDENGKIIFILDNNNIEKKKFIMPCRVDGCRGFLSSQYKCELCEQFTCNKCYDIIGNTEDKKNHICKEENILSTELIKKESKPCPSCGIRIQKIDGCTQMFCTECRTVFDYNTLKIQYGGLIHNPHYYEIKKAEGNYLPNMVEQVLCDGLIDLNTIKHMFNILKLHIKLNNYNDPKIKSFYDLNYKINLNNNKLNITITFARIVKKLYRYIEELNDLIIRRLNSSIISIDREDKEKITLDYILKYIDENTLGTKLQLLDNKKNKYIEKLHIYELFYAYAKDIINSLYNESVINMNELKLSIEECRTRFNYSVIDNFEKMNKIINYCNRLLANLSFTYNTVVDGISTIYEITLTNTHVNNNIYGKNNKPATKTELEKIMKNDDVIVSDIINERKSLLANNIL